MLEQLTYKNHVNETIVFGKDKIFVNTNELHNYSWNVGSQNNKISSFSKKITTFNIPVVIACKSEKEAIAIKNRLFEVCEKDVLAKEYGTITIGDYYLKCYIAESKKNVYLKSKNSMELTLKVVTDSPYWIKETQTTFNYGQGAQGTDLDYNNDFPYDYTSNILGMELNNPGFVEVNFRMRIYGACENPKVTIAGHDYEVLTELLANEYIIIDSINKTVQKISANGTISNLFNLRNKESYIFQKIPVGRNSVSNNGNFKFDVTLLEERGEPKWI